MSIDLTKLLDYIQPVLEHGTTQYNIVYGIGEGDAGSIRRCDACQKYLTAGVIANDIASIYHGQIKTNQKPIPDLGGCVVIKDPEKRLERAVLTFEEIHKAIRHGSDVFFDSISDRTDKHLAYQ